MLDRIRDAARHQNAAPLALAALLVAAPALFPRGMPGGLYGQGSVFGMQTALAAVGVLLVYRSDRIINLAHVQLGGAAALLFFELVKERQFIRWAGDACPGCVPSDPALAPWWMQTVNFVLAVAACMLLSVLAGLLVYVLVVRRFRDAPPLVGTVATLPVAQLLAYGASRLPEAFGDERGVSGLATLPFDVTLRWSPVVFHIGAIVTVVGGIAVFLAVRTFLTRSKAGVAVRATAENPDRAATLGMNAALVGAIVWMVAGAISGLTGIFTAMTAGATALGSSGVSLLVRVLAAAVIARMASFPIAVVTCIAIAVFEQGFLWSWSASGLVDVFVFGAVVAILLARRARVAGRVDETSWQAAREVRPVPSELRTLAVFKRWTRTGTVAGALVLLGFPFIFSPTDTSKGSLMLIFGIVGMSLLVLTGWAGQISLGQFAFAAVGGFTVSLLSGRLGWPILVSLVASVLAGAAVAVLVGLPALRIRGLYLAVTTLGFAVVTTNVLLAERFGGGAIPATLERPVVLGLDTADERVFYYLSLLALTGCVAAVLGMRRSRTARALIACRDNERAARSYGIDLVRARLEAFAVSGALAAFAGAVYAYHQQGVHIGNYAPDASLNAFLLVVIGGLSSVAGPLLGAAYVGASTIFLPNAVTLATASAAVLLLVFAPGGLAQLAFAARDALLRKIAERYRIVVPSLVADTTRVADRVPIAPKLLPTGAQAFVPPRYRLALYRPAVQRSGDKR